MKILPLLASLLLASQSISASHALQETQQQAGASLLEIGLQYLDAEQPRGASRWFQLAAAAGDNRARLQLGWLHESGALGAIDGDAAIDWYRQAVEAGASEYALKLAWIHLQGQLVPPDLTRAEAWFRHAIDAGHMEAHLALGSVLLAEVMAGAPRADEARDHLQQALAADWHMAAHFLGRIYLEGLGQPQDRARAMRYFRQGAEAGLPQSQGALAALLLEQAADTEERVEAATWAWLAAAQDDPQGMQVMATLARHLNQDEQKQARRQAWLAAGGDPGQGPFASDD